MQGKCSRNTRKTRNKPIMKETKPQIHSSDGEGISEASSCRFSFGFRVILSKFRSSILSLRAQSRKGVLGEILSELRPVNCVHPAEEGFANPGFKLFLCGLSASSVHSVLPPCTLCPTAFCRFTRVFRGKSSESLRLRPKAPAAAYWDKSQEYTRSAGPSALRW